MLNGDTPVEGRFYDHYLNQLEDDEDDSDSEYSTSNAHESVRKDLLVYFRCS